MPERKGGEEGEGRTRNDTQGGTRNGKQVQWTPNLLPRWCFWHTTSFRLIASPSGVDSPESLSWQLDHSPGLQGEQPPKPPKGMFALTFSSFPAPNKADFAFPSRLRLISFSCRSASTESPVARFPAPTRKINDSRSTEKAIRRPWSYIRQE